MKEKTLCFAGHRSLPRGKKLEVLKKQVLDEIQKSLEEGYTRFMFGAFYGFDLLCGELLVEYKKKEGLNYDVVSVIAYEEQAVDFKPKDHEKYYETLSKCDDEIELSGRYTDDCFEKRNQFMVDYSSKLIAYYNGDAESGTGQTVSMAEKQNLKIINLFEALT